MDNIPVIPNERFNRWVPGVELSDHDRCVYGLSWVMRESLSLSIGEVILGIIKTSTTDTHYYTHNYVIILGKWFINLKKNNEERIWFSDYMARQN